MNSIDTGSIIQLGAESTDILHHILTTVLRHHHTLTVQCYSENKQRRVSLTVARTGPDGALEYRSVTTTFNDLDDVVRCTEIGWINGLQLSNCVLVDGSDVRYVPYITIPIDTDEVSPRDIATALGSPVYPCTTLFVIEVPDGYQIYGDVLLLPDEWQAFLRRAGDWRYPYGAGERYIAQPHIIRTYQEEGSAYLTLADPDFDLPRCVATVRADSRHA